MVAAKMMTAKIFQRDIRRQALSLPCYLNCIAQLGSVKLRPQGGRWLFERRGEEPRYPLRRRSGIHKYRTLLGAAVNGTGPGKHASLISG